MSSVTRRLRRRASRAFTLVEIVIVILVLGVLAGVAAPRLLMAQKDAAQGAFARQTMVFYDAIERYQAEHGVYPTHSPDGQFPVELETYVRAPQFGQGTPIGGIWDYRLNPNGRFAGIGVYFPSSGGHPGTQYMSEVDSIIDDGNPSTGIFQSREGGDRYYAIQNSL